jgi:hypothetical protein
VVATQPAVSHSAPSGKDKRRASIAEKPTRQAITDELVAPSLEVEDAWFDELEGRIEKLKVAGALATERSQLGS